MSDRLLEALAEELCSQAYRDVAVCCMNQQAAGGVKDASPVVWGAMLARMYSKVAQELPANKTGDLDEDAYYDAVVGLAAVALRALQDFDPEAA